MTRILVVEDDMALNQLICMELSKNHYQIDGCRNPIEAMELQLNKVYNLIISDIMMPELNGFEFAEYIRIDNKLIPILFISALDDIKSKQRGFRTGIDDYMVKPIDMDELILRVESLLRRSQIRNENELVIGSLRLVKDEMAAFYKEEEIEIMPREFYVLNKLLSYPRKIFTRSELIDEFWGMESETGLRTVDVYITKLRSKFKICDEFEIVTVHGFGYKAIIK